MEDWRNFKTQDWFSINKTFVFTDTEDLFEQLFTSCDKLLHEIDTAYTISLENQPLLAKNMLEIIGVNTDAKSR